MAGLENNYRSLYREDFVIKRFVKSRFHCTNWRVKISLYVFELDAYLKKHSLPYKKKLKNEKIGLITSHLQEVRGQILATVTVPGQHLLQANKPGTSGDDDESDGDNTVVVGET